MQLKKIKKNKRADVPVTILVLGVFAVCTMAILSFINSDRSVEKSFIGLEILEKANIDIETHNLNYYYEDKVIKKLVPRFGSGWIQEKTLFSIEYNPGNRGSP